ncbi:MAG TPA: HD domain-containing phosphohydrolase [Fimbriimonadales bacterium]|nr:HD domain-containing phosphohydrolase [Fimbriimonadales bacterium]
MRKSLRVKIQVLFTLVLFALATIVVVTIAFIVKKEIEARIESSVDRCREYLTSTLHENKLSLLRQLRFATGLSALEVNFLNKSSISITELSRFIVEQSGADGLTFTDIQGEVIAKAGEVTEKLTMQSENPGVSIALRGGSWAGIRSYPSGLFLVATVPYTEGNRICGTITIYSKIGSEIAESIYKILGVHVAFVDGNKIVGSSMPISSPLPIQSGVFHKVFDGAKEYLGIYSSLPDSSYNPRAGYVAFIDVDEIVTPYRNIFYAFLCVFLCILAIGMLIFGKCAGYITHSLARLVDAALTVQEGRWPEKFEVTREDEIGVLQTAFNEMTDSLQASQQRLLAMSDLDPLTNLENHRCFKESLQREITRCDASKETASLLVIDVDRFNSYNSNYGHHVGDEALKLVAEVLRETAPEFATIARYGGEEFAILLPLYHINQAMSLAENIRNKVKAAFSERDIPCVTVSIGGAEYRVNTTEPEGLLLAAEIAMNRAKQLGRDRIARFDQVPGVNSSADPYQLFLYLQDGSFAAMQALAAAVDAKDHYTQGHSDRVARYAAHFMRFIGASEQEIELAYRAGTLHDVGKIGVPDSILQKPGPLTDEEREVMQTHTVVGELVVRKVPQLEDVLPAVRSHHERWDGNGYPDKLKGEEIPKIARVIALVDAYDAMTSERPYRKALSKEEALREIEKASGTHFDPVLAPLFVEMIRQSEISEEEFAA